MLTIYTKNNCGQCVQAKALLRARGAEFEEINIETTDWARQLVTEHGHRTMPQIYLDGKVFVEGGYQGLSKLTEDEFNLRLGKSNLGSI